MKEALEHSLALLLGMALLMLGAGLAGHAARRAGDARGLFDIRHRHGHGRLLRRLCRRLARRARARAASGHIRVFAALTAVAAATILVQSIFVAAWFWALLRAVSGVCFAGIYVVAESWLNDRADSRSRGTLLATYMVVIYVGLGLGQFLLNLADAAQPVAVHADCRLISLAVVPMALTAQRAPEFALPQRFGFRELFASRRSARSASRSRGRCRRRCSRSGPCMRHAAVSGHRRFDVHGTEHPAGHRAAAAARPLLGSDRSAHAY